MDTGVHESVSDFTYHADKLGLAPSLNRSLGRLFVEASPLHVWAAHPRLGGDEPQPPTNEQELGKAIHLLAASQGAMIDVIDAPDRRKKETREQIAESRDAGRVPVMAADIAAVEGAALAVRSVIGDAATGRWENTIFWPDDGHWYRARPDLIAGADVWDIKTTAGYASAHAWARHIVGDFGDMQLAAVEDGMQAVGMTMASYRWVVVEQRPPHGVAIVTASESLVDFGRERWRFAKRLWKNCREADTWPGYPPVPVEATVAPFEEYRWAARKGYEQAMDWLTGDDPLAAILNGGEVR